MSAGLAVAGDPRALALVDGNVHYQFHTETPEGQVSVLSIIEKSFIRVKGTIKPMSMPTHLTICLIYNFSACFFVIFVSLNGNIINSAKYLCGFTSQCLKISYLSNYFLIIFNAKRKGGIVIKMV